MSVLKYFKNITRSPSHRATGPKCNFFFFKFATKSLERKKSPVARWGGRQGPVAQPTGDRRWARPTGAAGGLSPPPRGRQGACRPPRATGVPTPIKGLTLPFPPHLSPKIPPKIQKKKEEWGEGKRRSPAGFSTCDLQVSTFSLYIFPFKYYAFKYE